MTFDLLTLVWTTGGHPLLMNSPAARSHDSAIIHVAYHASFSTGRQTDWQMEWQVLQRLRHEAGWTDRQTTINRWKADYFIPKGKKKSNISHRNFFLNLPYIMQHILKTIFSMIPLKFKYLQIFKNDFMNYVSSYFCKSITYSQRNNQQDPCVQYEHHSSW